MSNRAQRKRTAQETVEILERGRYRLPEGDERSIADALKAAWAGTRLYTPESLATLRQDLALPAAGHTECRVENCTTLAAARRLIEADAGDEPLCLNFASAKNPGGGFLGGSQAQEESLARASGLYACIEPVEAYYQANRACGTGLYTDHLMYSPSVPVFRDDDDELLSDPYAVAFVTSPAVNAGAVHKNEPHRAGMIEPAMRRRVDAVLAVAAAHGHSRLVLGAWGCGVFRNDPAQVAGWFHDALAGDGRFAGAFGEVVFAVLDGSRERATYHAFAQRFVVDTES